MIRRTLAAVLFLVAVFGAAKAHAGMITYTQDSTRIHGYLALPRGEGTHAAVLVVHEWWGINDWVKQQCDSLAKHGYIAFAADLYKGQVANDQDTAHQLMSGLVETDAMRILRASTDFLRSRSDVRANAIGVIGWCMGGKFSIRAAAADPGIRACVMYYGAPITDENSIRELQATVLGNFGGQDKGPAPDQVKTFEAALKKAGKKADFKIYPDAGHAFANVNNPWGGYREADAKDAWKRTLTFFDKELKKASVPKSSK